MTDREKAIVSAYTGIAMLTGDKFSLFHKYVEDILGRSVWTHELADRAVWEEIREKSKADFLAICAASEPEYIIKAKDKSEEDMRQLVQAWKSNKDGVLLANDDFEIIPIKKPVEWIPVSERLPEEKTNTMTNDFEFVLCTTIWEDVRPYKFGKRIGENKAHFWHGGEIMDKYITAWQPFPEPYNDPLDHRGEPQCKAENCSPEGCKHCAGYKPIDFGGEEE